MYTYMTTRRQQDFREKIQAAMEREGLDALVLTSPEYIFYATGFISSMYGRGETVGSDIAVVMPSGRVTLITSQFTRGGAELQTRGEVDILSYATYICIEDYFDPDEIEKPSCPDLMCTFRMARDIVSSRKPRPVVGVERGCLPYDYYVFLQECFGDGKLRDIEAFMVGLKSIKMPWEVNMLRASAQITERMMSDTMDATRVGMTEADLFKVWWQSAYEITGGHEVFNVRQAHTPGPDFWCTPMARERPLVEGDVVRLDGGLTLYGYHSDLGRVYAVGDTASPRKQEIFDTLLKAYDKGIGLMVPGSRACDVFRETMKVCNEGALPNYVRGHVGHSIGLGPGEERPMISPDNEGVLVPGMVFCFEVPYYSSANGSYNLEDTLVITEDGHELFTHTNRSLFQW